MTLFLIYLVGLSGCFLTVDKSSEVIMNSSALLVTLLRITYSCL